MNGTLLGGFKIQLNDGNGNPLSAIGRVCFYKAGTLAGSSVPLEVYSSKAMDVSLGTTVYSDAKGYLPDVWLRTDYLYDVRVERKVQDDPETWVKEYDVYNVGSLDDAYTGAYNENLTFAANISALRTVDFTKFGNVFVAGYYTPGDWGEPSLFVYDSSCRKTSNDASYVLPDSLQERNSGRWVQKFSGTLIDVRKFGALPDLEGIRKDILSQIVNCITYCIDNTLNKDALSVGFLKSGKYQFSGDLDLDQYKYTYSDGSTRKVFYEIREGVIFCSLAEDGGELKMGQNTNCRSMYKITDLNTTLVLPEYIQYPIYAAWAYRSTANHEIVIFGEGVSASKPEVGFAFDLKNGKFYADYLSVEDNVAVGTYVFTSAGVFRNGQNNLFHVNTDNNVVFDCARTLVPQLTYTSGAKSYECNVNDFMIVDQTDASNVKSTTITAEGIDTTGDVSADGDLDVGGDANVNGELAANTLKCIKLFTNKSTGHIGSNFNPPIVYVSELVHEYGLPFSELNVDSSFLGIRIDMTRIAFDGLCFDGEFIVIVNDVTGYFKSGDSTARPCPRVELKYIEGAKAYGKNLSYAGAVTSNDPSYEERTDNFGQSETIILLNQKYATVSGTNYRAFTRVV